MLELPPAEAASILPPPANLTATLEGGTVERNDANFPPHMMMWAIIGVVLYFAIIAAAMIYAAVISPPGVR
jgi:hypothetical protein